MLVRVREGLVSVALLLSIAGGDAQDTETPQPVELLPPSLLSAALTMPVALAGPSTALTTFSDPLSVVTLAVTTNLPAAPVEASGSVSTVRVVEQSHEAFESPSPEPATTAIAPKLPEMTDPTSSTLPVSPAASLDVPPWSSSTSTGAGIPQNTGAPIDAVPSDEVLPAQTVPATDTTMPSPSEPPVTTTQAPSESPIVPSTPSVADGSPIPVPASAPNPRPNAAPTNGITIDATVGTVAPSHGAIDYEVNPMPTTDNKQDARPSTHGSAPSSHPLPTAMPEPTGSSVDSTLPPTEPDTSEATAQEPSSATSDLGVNTPILSGSMPRDDQSTKEKDALTAVNKLTSTGSETESADWNALLVIGLVGGCGVVVGVLLAVEIYLRRSRRRHIRMCEIQRPILAI